MMIEHIHVPGDGRGRRIVFVNGRQIPDVFYADTQKGIADQYRRDKWGEVRLHKHGKRPLSKRLKGRVEVFADGH